MSTAIFLSVLVAWIGSVMLHEYAHARVAYAGGDTSVLEKGYLSLNPFKYLHPVTSFILPVVILALGGVPLPGGAVYIDTSRLRSRAWDSWVSAAGPLSNLALFFLCASPFYLGICDPVEAQSSVGWITLATFCYFQILAVILNLIPIPPLDGWGIIEPYMSYETRMKAREFANIGFIILILLLFYPTPLRDAFWGLSDAMADLVDIDMRLVYSGLDAFRKIKDF